MYSGAVKRLSRQIFKPSKESLKKPKDLKKPPNKQPTPTEIEDLICQLDADRDQCSAEVDLMVAKLFQEIQSKKRPRIDLEENSLRQVIQKNVLCQ
jgi:hypothetical protein